MASSNYINYEYNYKKLSHKHSTAYVNFHIMCEHIEHLVDPLLRASINRFSFGINDSDNTARIRYTLRGIDSNTHPSINNIQPSITGMVIVEDYHFKEQEHIIIEAVTQIEQTARNIINGRN